MQESEGFETLPAHSDLLCTSQELVALAEGEPTPPEPADEAPGEAPRDAPGEAAGTPDLPNAREFSPDELTSVEALETKYDDLRTNALLMAKGHFTGLYAYGPGGVGKSHQIRQALDSAHRPYTLINTHVTGAALFHKMADFPHGLYLVEDLETLFNDKIARNALRAALWGERNAEGGMVRHVSYTTMRDQIEFDFKGGVIFTMNRPLKDVPEIAALATRILVTNFCPTRTELLAVAKKIALAGYRTDKGSLSPEQTLEVYDYLKAHLDRIPDRLPDLRLLFKGFEYRLAVSISSLPNSPLTWQESFRAQLEQSQEALVHDRKGKWERQEKLALKLYAQKERGLFDGKAMLARFKAATGVSSSQTFYNRLHAAQARSGVETPAARNGEVPAEGTAVP